MKRIVAISLFLCLLSSSAWADGVLNAFVSKASKSYLVFDYKYELKGSFSMAGSGRGEICGGAYHLSGNDIEIWCDGSTRWTVDTYAKEVIVESVSVSEEITANPAIFMTDVSKFFDTISSGGVRYNNADCHKVVLRPKTNSTIAELSLFFVSSVLKYAQLKLTDGNLNEFEISNLKFSDTLKTFTFNVKTLDDSWVVTDFRN